MHLIGDFTFRSLDIAQDLSFIVHLALSILEFYFLRATMLLVQKDQQDHLVQLVLCVNSKVRSIIAFLGTGVSAALAL